MFINVYRVLILREQSKDYYNEFLKLFEFNPVEVINWVIKKEQ